MALLQIPTRVDLKSYEMFVTLDGIEYQLKFEYNFRDGFWYMSIIDLVYGQKLVHGNVLFDQFKHLDNFPQGDFVVADKSGLERDPDIETFGDTVILAYDEAL